MPNPANAKFRNRCAFGCVALSPSRAHDIPLINDNLGTSCCFLQLQFCPSALFSSLHSPIVFELVIYNRATTTPAAPKSAAPPNVALFGTAAPVWNEDEALLLVLLALD